MKHPPQSLTRRRRGGLAAARTRAQRPLLLTALELQRLGLETLLRRPGLRLRLVRLL